MSDRQTVYFNIPQTLGSIIKRRFPNSPDVHLMVDNGSNELLDVISEAYDKIVSQEGELDERDKDRSKELRDIHGWLRDVCSSLENVRHSRV